MPTHTDDEIDKEIYEWGELERDAERTAQFTTYGGWLYRFFMWVARNAREAREELRQIKRAPKPPDWEAFGREVMEAWPEGDLDGFALQDCAEKHHIILAVPGGFDPEVHTNNLYDAEPGDPWFTRNYPIR